MTELHEPNRPRYYRETDLSQVHADFVVFCENPARTVIAFTLWEHRVMTVRRLVLGAIGHGAPLAALARQWRDEGHEVVLVGGHQSAEQLVSAALAEDAHELMVLGDERSLAEVDRALRRCGAGDIRLTAARSPSPTAEAPES